MDQSRQDHPWSASVMVHQRFGDFVCRCDQHLPCARGTPAASMGTVDGPGSAADKLAPATNPPPRGPRLPQNGAAATPASSSMLSASLQRRPCACSCNCRPRPPAPAHEPCDRMRIVPVAPPAVDRKSRLSDAGAGDAANSGPIAATPAEPACASPSTQSMRRVRLTHTQVRGSRFVLRLFST